MMKMIMMVVLLNNEISQSSNIIVLLHFITAHNRNTLFPHIIFCKDLLLLLLSFIIDD